MNKIKNGGFAGGCKALGYLVRDGELEIDNETAETVKKIFYLKRYKRLSLNGIAKKLNDEKVKTARGGKLYAGTVRYILQNSIYRGSLVYNGVKAKTPDLCLV